MTKIQRKALLLSICIATILTGALYYYLNLRSLNTSPLVKVVVAKTTIPANSAIDEKQVEEASVPLKFILPDAVQGKEEIIGKFAKVDIMVGEQVVKSRVQWETKREGLAGNLPLGFRAVTLKVDTVSNVNNKINSGDFIDILLYFKSSPPPATEMVNTVFQGVEVIDVSGDLGSGERFITLLFKPEEAEKLFLADVIGEIRFALRPTEDKEKLTLPGASSNSLR